MKKGLKLLSGVIMASIISTSFSGFNNINDVFARTSRPVKHTSLSGDTSSETTDSENTSEESSSSSSSNSSSSSTSGGSTESDHSSSDSESSRSSNTTSILEALNEDDTLKEEDLYNLSLPISYSEDFLSELKDNFKYLEPLRKISPIYTSYTPYLDTAKGEVSYVNDPISKSKDLSIYGEQNKCNVLLSAIPKELEEIDKSIKEEYNSTIFSLLPTITVFNDTYNVLSLKYQSILNSNYKNHVTLNLMLKDLSPQIESLLNSIKTFKKELPDLISTLNKLVENSTSSKDEVTDEDSEENDDTSSSEDSDTSTDSDSSTSGAENEGNSNTSSNTNSSGNTGSSSNTGSSTTEGESNGGSSNNNSSSNENTSDTSVTEEETDPTKVILYFGEAGEELIFNESENKYYQLDPENPDSGNLLPYEGEVTSMTLADYLAMELYFDQEGNELYYDDEHQVFFYYDENDAEVIYDGEVTTMTMEEYLNSLQ